MTWIAKHPILAALFAAIVLTVVAGVVLPFTAQEAPWAILLLCVAFPFVWFLAWLVTNVISIAFDPERKTAPR